MWLVVLREKNHRLEMMSLVLKLMIPKLDVKTDLSAVSTFTRNVMLIN